MNNQPVPLDARLLGIVRRSRRRVVASKLCTATVDGLLTAALLVLAFGTVADSAGLGSGGWILFLVLLGLGLCAHLAREALTGSSLRAVAILLDRQLGFHDRISSALAFSSVSGRTAFMQAHLEETTQFLEERGQEVLPFPGVGRGRVLALFLALTLVALLPHSDRAALDQLDRRERVDQHKRRARKLVEEMRKLRREADLRGLHKLSEMVAAVEEDLSRQLDLVTEEDRAPPDLPEPEARADSTSTAPDDTTAETASTPLGDGSMGDAPAMKYASQASYQPVGKFDSFPQEAYTQVFAELDEALLGDEMMGVELTNLAEHLDTVANKMANFGSAAELDSVMQEAPSAMSDNVPEEFKYDKLERYQAALQWKSFSEFLKRYSSHLGDKALGKPRFKPSDEENTGGEVFDVSAPPPKDGKFSIQGVSDQAGNMPILQATAEQVAKVASQLKGSASGTGKGGPKAKGGGTELGGKGAGMGGASRAGAAPAVLPRASGGEYLPLKGRLGDGKRVIEVINDRGRRNITSRGGEEVTYREVFVEYATAAEAELNSEQVPLHMRDYIRDYFRSIRPGLETKGTGASTHD